MQILTVGCDPEVFLTKAGRIIPSSGYLSATKEKPKQIAKNTLILKDNVLVEFNTRPVIYKDENSLFDSANASLQDCRAYLQGIDKELDLEIKDHHYFSAEELHKVEDAWVFGCDPFLSAYSHGEEVEADAINALSTSGTGRCSGGHIHFGYDQYAHDIPKWALVLLCDLTLLAHTNLAPAGSAARRGFYGQLGAYRDKPYGFEYRTPSNLWLTERGKAIQADLCRTVHWAINNPEKARALYDRINPLTGDVRAAFSAYYGLDFAKCEAKNYYEYSDFLALHKEFVK